MALRGLATHESGNKLSKMEYCCMYCKMGFRRDRLRVVALFELRAKTTIHFSIPLRVHDIT